MGWQPVAHFDVIGPDLDASPAGIVRLAPVHVAATWDVSEVYGRRVPPRAPWCRAPAYRCTTNPSWSVAP